LGLTKAMLPAGALLQRWATTGLLLFALISNVRCINEQVWGDIAAAEAEAQEGAKTAHGRSLQQNPDRPALNAYGGVNMTSKWCIRYSCGLTLLVQLWHVVCRLHSAVEALACESTPSSLQLNQREHQAAGLLSTSAW
jgi:hypothetical protein